jgi:hypothetical protein
MQSAGDKGASKLSFSRSGADGPSQPNPAGCKCIQSAHVCDNRSVQILPALQAAASSIIAAWKASPAV